RVTRAMSAASSLEELRPKAPADQKAEHAGRHPRIRERLVGLHTRSRRTISEHRHKRKLRDREVSDRSRRGLDWTNFFLADVQMSFGSFLAFYLADLGWSKQNVGLALTVGGSAGVPAQIPGGALADAVHWKRGLAASGFVLNWRLVLFAGCLVLFHFSSASLLPLVSQNLAHRHDGRRDRD